MPPQTVVQHTYSTFGLDVAYTVRRLLCDARLLPIVVKTAAVYEPSVV